MAEVRILSLETLVSTLQQAVEVIQPHAHDLAVELEAYKLEVATGQQNTDNLLANLATRHGVLQQEAVGAVTGLMYALRHL